MCDEPLYQIRKMRRCAILILIGILALLSEWHILGWDKKLGPDSDRSGIAGIGRTRGVDRGSPAGGAGIRAQAPGTEILGRQLRTRSRRRLPLRVSRRLSLNRLHWKIRHGKVSLTPWECLQTAAVLPVPGAMGSAARAVEDAIESTARGLSRLLSELFAWIAGRAVSLVAIGVIALLMTHRIHAAYFWQWYGTGGR